MELLLIRHGKAEEHGHPFGDGARALTEKGHLQARKVGQFLRRQDLVPDLVLCSPLVRARETAELVCEEAGVDAPVVQEWLACGMDGEEALRELGAYAGTMETVAIVGHEPDFSSLLGHILGARQGYVQVKKASVILVRVQAPRAGGLLQFSIWPSMLPDLGD